MHKKISRSPSLYNFPSLPALTACYTVDAHTKAELKHCNEHLLPCDPLVDLKGCRRPDLTFEDVVYPVSSELANASLALQSSEKEQLWCLVVVLFTASPRVCLRSAAAFRAALLVVSSDTCFSPGSLCQNASTLSFISPIVRHIVRLRKLREAARSGEGCLPGRTSSGPGGSPAMGPRR